MVETISLKHFTITFEKPKYLINIHTFVKNYLILNYVGAYNRLNKQTLTFIWI